MSLRDNPDQSEISSSIRPWRRMQRMTVQAPSVMTKYVAK